MAVTDANWDGSSTVGPPSDGMGEPGQPQLTLAEALEEIERLRAQVAQLSAWLTACGINAEHWLARVGL